MRMAEMANNEPSKQVAHAVRTALETAAELDHPDNRELSENAEAARQLLDDDEEDVPEGVQNSRTHIHDWIMEEMNLAYTMQASKIGSEDSLWPKVASIQITKNMGGYKHRWNEYHAMISSVDQLIELVKDQFSSGQRKNKLHKNQPQENQPKKSGFDLDEIEKLLDLQSEQQEQLEGQILMKINNMKRFWTFNNETIEKIPQYLQRAAKELSSGHQFDYSKMYNQEVVEIGFPLASGLPFTFVHRTPALVRTGGDLRLTTNPPEFNFDGKGLPTQVTLSGTWDSIFASQIDAQVGFTTVFDQQRYSAGIQKKLQVRLPVRMNINLDLVKSQVSAEFENMDTKDATLLHMSSWPYTERRSLEACIDLDAEHDTKLVSVDEEKNMHARIGEKSTGFVLDINAKYEKEPISIEKIWEHIQIGNWDELATAFAELQSCEHWKLEILTNQQSSSAQKVKLQVQLEKKESFEDEDKLQHPRNTQKTMPWQNQDLLKLRQELNKLGGSWNNAEITGTQVQIKFVDASGNSKTKFQSNILVGNSKVSHDWRCIVNTNVDAMKYKKEMNLRAYIQAPNVPELNLNDALKSQDEAKWKIELEFGDAEEPNKAKITMKRKAEQSDERRQEVERSEDAEECRKQMKAGNFLQEECRNAIHQASIYDRYTYTIDYDNISSKQKELANKIAHLSRGRIYSMLARHEVSSNDRKSGNKQVQIELQYDPEDLESVNVTLKTQNYEKHYADIQVPSYVTKYLLVNPEDACPYQKMASEVTNDAHERKFCY
jgi:hypothetical protein